MSRTSLAVSFASRHFESVSVGLVLRVSLLRGASPADNPGSHTRASLIGMAVCYYFAIDASTDRKTAPDGPSPPSPTLDPSYRSTNVGIVPCMTRLVYDTSLRRLVPRGSRALSTGTLRNFFVASRRNPSSTRFVFATLNPHAELLAPLSPSSTSHRRVSAS